MTQMQRMLYLLQSAVSSGELHVLFLAHNASYGEHLLHGSLGYARAAIGVKPAESPMQYFTKSLFQRRLTTSSLIFKLQYHHIVIVGHPVISKTLFTLKDERPGR